MWHVITPQGLLQKTHNLATAKYYARLWGTKIIDTDTGREYTA